MDARLTLPGAAVSSTEFLDAWDVISRQPEVGQLAQAGMTPSRSSSGRDRILVGDNVDAGGVGIDDISGLGGPDSIDGGPGIDRCDGGASKDTATNCETQIDIP